MSIPIFARSYLSEIHFPVDSRRSSSLSLILRESLFLWVSCLAQEAFSHTVLHQFIHVENLKPQMSQELF